MVDPYTEQGTFTLTECVNKEIKLAALIVTNINFNENETFTAIDYLRSSNDCSKYPHPVDIDFNNGSLQRIIFFPCLHKLKKHIYKWWRM